MIGGGSAGYHAASTASSAGLRVGLIESAERFGGLCILRGCMPTKTLLRSAEIAQLVRESDQLGIRSSSPRVDWPAVRQRKDELVEEFASYRQVSAEKLANVEIICGRAEFLGPDSIEVGGQVLNAPKFAVTTGSEIAIPPLPGLEDVGYIDSDEAQTLDRLPESLLVIGGGAVALEFAQLFLRLGVAVTVVQRSAHVLSGMDSAIGIALAGYLEREGMTVVTETDILGFERAPDGRKQVRVNTPSGERTFAAQEILIALGRRPATRGLGLDRAGVDTDRGWILVNTRMQTSNPNIYAAGDCIGPEVGPLQVVHTAVQQGQIIGNNVAERKPQEFDLRVVPQAVFTDPSVGVVGLSEVEARDRHSSVIVAQETFEDQGKALTMGQNKGLVKMVADGVTGELLGVHVLGPEAADLIHEAVVAMHYRATVDDFARIPHLHPTLAEIMVDPAEELAEMLAMPAPAR
ncbi:MAG: dihydrolipoyl dehydrogenase [Chloroflexi bacterium]|nr:dihydrolipoyl dehydrogenase [Chloroflexota bacterium]MDE2702813.1 dihydrolipoyl dehydrogenase [Chloroflexota bacterium]MXW27450.1 dihydrolipoyl dehydrogenase [Chloroflexota bacterium]MXX66264.1 dihydrolipoyl dehydrogenase [Chloroflexota bacterium]MXY12718.1 dihydrolipoyl dehydrogenase [Chloroflexota bacterium]